MLYAHSILVYRPRRAARVCAWRCVRVGARASVRSVIYLPHINRRTLTSFNNEEKYFTFVQGQRVRPPPIAGDLLSGKMRAAPSGPSRSRAKSGAGERHYYY